MKIGQVLKSKAEEVLGAQDRANVPNLMHDTHLRQIDISRNVNSTEENRCKLCPVMMLIKGSSGTVVVTLKFVTNNYFSIKQLNSDIWMISGQ